MAKKEASDLKYGISKKDDVNAYQVKRTLSLYYRPTIYINKEQDADMVEFLKTKGSVSDYIISLIRDDMTKGKR